MSTICAPATASGGAMAIIRVSGPDAIAITSRIFSKDLTNAKGYTLHYGWIKSLESLQVQKEHEDRYWPNFSGNQRPQTADASRQQTDDFNSGKGTYKTAEADVIDDVVVSVFRTPHSYTGEDTTEISCHGSHYIVQKILEALILSGAEMAAPGEFTKRAFLAGKMDLSQAEAVADLIASGSEATHRMAMSQMRGGFSRELDSLRAQLLRLTSLLELELDFSDHEDLEFADRSELSSIADTLYAHVHRLTDSFRTGNALKKGIPVAIIGAPNVGKSTLLNALVHEERAIVSDIQGTTRDLIEDTIQIDGITFRFIDTAGIRDTSDHIELLGIERSIQAAQKADIIILLTEPNQPFPDTVPLSNPSNIILHVINKSDLLSKETHLTPHTNIPQATTNPLYISSRTGFGLSSLQDSLLSAAKQLLSSIEATDTTIVTNLRHYEALLHSQEALLRIKNALTANLPGDLIAEDLRQCLHYLAEITGGEITSSEVLSNIFQHFCIGK
ncbi:MAG: tRNA uridine-5-carboxymethylaminomethyl(34) synthesis GTPase MnmE [Paraprevotella sp.]|nr:tRNA uridine-5-carboxymethylaminomethyl(34) synthesis GTPase MnmE [Paraprevotella sp.]